MSEVKAVTRKPISNQLIREKRLKEIWMEPLPSLSIKYDVPQGQGGTIFVCSSNVTVRESSSCLSQA